MSPFLEFDSTFVSYGCCQIDGGEIRLSPQTWTLDDQIVKMIAPGTDEVHEYKI